MRKMTYIQASALYNTLNRFRGVTGIKTAYTIAKNIKALEMDARFYEDRRSMLVKEYGTEEEDGSYIVKPGSEGYDKFIEKIVELANTETEVDISTLPPDTPMEAFECETATASDYLTIMDYLVEKQEKKEEEDGGSAEG